MGPTATFMIENFTLMHDVRSLQRRPRSCSSDYLTSPLLVLNGMKPSQMEEGSGSVPLNLLHTMITGMFPAIDLAQMNVRSCKRIVLIQYNKQSQLFELRHYAIIRRPAGVSRQIKKVLMKTRDSKLCSIGRGEDVADYILASENGMCPSDSEVEDEVEVKVPTTQSNQYGDTLGLSEKSACLTGKVSVSLKELGPRITMKLIKVVDEVCDGAVIYHNFVKKTPSELLQLQLKEDSLKRKRQDERNQFQDDPSPSDNNSS